MTAADATTDDLAFFMHFFKVFSLESRSILAFLFACSTGTLIFDKRANILSANSPLLLASDHNHLLRPGVFCCWYRWRCLHDVGVVFSPWCCHHFDATHKLSLRLLNGLGELVEVIPQWSRLVCTYFISFTIQSATIHRSTPDIKNVLVNLSSTVFNEKDLSHTSFKFSSCLNCRYMLSEHSWIWKV